MTFAVISYGTAAAAFLLLATLLATSWRGHSVGARLIVASSVTGIWAVIMAYAEIAPVPAIVVFIAEVLHDGAWLLALVAIGGGAVSGVLVSAIYVLWIGLLILGIVLPAIVELDGDGVARAALMTRGGLACALLGLVLLEQIYRNAEPSARSRLKWMVAGIGGLFAYDLFLFSQAELLREISIDAWNVRGFIYALTVPAMAFAIRRNPQWSLDIFVSRHVVFYSTTFVVVGGYLLLMALGGYYVRANSGTWGATGQILFFVLGSVLLFSMLASDALRRRLKVFINKHFYRNKYDYRVEWLRFIRTLSSTDEGDIRRTALRAVTQIFGSPGGALLLVDESRRRFVPAAAWPVNLDSIPGLAEVRAGHPLISFLNERQWIIDLRELRDTPEVYGHLELPAWIRADPTLRIVSPMLELDRLVGFFVLYSPPPPFDMTYEDRDLLKTVGQHVATQIAQHESDRKLAESRQFEAYNRLTAFMMHDLKNSVAQLRLIVANAEKHRRNPEFVDDAIATIANASQRMSRLIDQLRGTNADAVRLIALDEIVAAAVQRCKGRMPVVTMTLPGQSVWVRADSDRLGAIVEHVLRNAQDATPDEGLVHCNLVAGDSEVILVVVDNGAGMTPEFVRDRLFRPFDSTKGAKGMGIGAYQTQEYVRTLGGEIEVQSSPGMGTRFSIRLPVSAPPGVTAGAAAVAGTQLDS